MGLNDNQNFWIDTDYYQSLWKQCPVDSYCYYSHLLREADEFAVQVAKKTYKTDSSLE